MSEQQNTVRVNDILALMFRRSNEAQQAASQLGDLIDQLIAVNAQLEKRIKELESKKVTSNENTDIKAH